MALAIACISFILVVVIGALSSFVIASYVVWDLFRGR